MELVRTKEFRAWLRNTPPAHRYKLTERNLVDKFIEIAEMEASGNLELLEKQ